MSTLSCSLGIRQAKLDADTRAFFREARPWSFILFREACVSRGQVAALCADLRDAVGSDALIYIDQEGGRVARLKPPEWPTWPACERYGEVHARDPALGLESARLGHRLIAHELKTMGVDGDFAPVLDVRRDGADAIVGDRSFSKNPQIVAQLARAALDSHLALPRVTASEQEMEADLVPFIALADVEAAMTAHIVYACWDSDRPATCSPIVVNKIIRGRIGFQGLLMSDDLDMKALQYAMNGGLQQRAEAALSAGCDVVLQCSGVLKDMEATAQGCRVLAGMALVRTRAVEAFAKRRADGFDASEGWTRLHHLLKP
jgi:beta-N-acetylhexosaminidase